MNSKLSKKLRKLAKSLPPTLKLGDKIVSGVVLEREYPDRIAPEQKIEPSARYRIKVKIPVDHFEELKQFYKNSSNKQAEANVQQYTDYVHSLFLNFKNQQNEEANLPAANSSSPDVVQQTEHESTTAESDGACELSSADEQSSE